MKNILVLAQNNGVFMVISRYSKVCIALLSLFFSLLGSSGSSWYAHSSRVYWDWDRINTNSLQFPKGFLMGVGTSAYQVEGGCTNNQWCEYEGDTEKDMPELCGDACDHWNRYKEDVQLIKKLGAKAYRFSVEWSKIEPSEGQFDVHVLDHYRDVCDELIANGIKPAITVVHYTIPRWFADKSGFEKGENIQYFVRFFAKLYEHLGDRVHLWLTFNSPVGYAMPSYYKGTKPPYKKDMQLALTALKNLLEAHVQGYKKIKSMPNGHRTKIGILKNIYQLDPYRLYNPIDRLTCFMGNKLAHTISYEFFRTGKFNAYVPFKVSVTHTNHDAPHSLDFIGLNYYSHGMMCNGAIIPNESEISTKNPRYTIYPEGIYRALMELSHNVAKPLNIPIYITENGIAAHSDADRDIFLKRYLYAVSEAIKDGCDVRGYFHWSLMDNYEWGTYSKRYGLYHVDFNTQKRTLKPGSQHFVDVALQIG